MRWLRLYTDVKDDPKIRKMELDEQAVFFLLLTLAAEEEKNGVIPLEAEDIAWSLRLPLDLTERAVEKCLERGILSKNGHGYSFTNWAKRQFPSDNVSDRVKKWRESKKDETLQETLQQRCEQQESNALDREIDTSLSGEKGSSPPCEPQEEIPHKQIVDLYHNILPECPKVKVWTDERKRQLRARWREDPKRRSLEWWERYFQYVRESPFLMGGGRGKWVADLEWLTRKKKLVQVIEGIHHHG